MREKKPVYRGYEEQYLTGKGLSEQFAGRYLTTGRHHSVVLGVSIPDYLLFLGISEEKIYRIFVNSAFCRLMKGDTDGAISFFGHTSLADAKLSIDPAELHLPHLCPACGAPMRFQEGRFGAFLGCSQYPACKSTIKIPIIGNLRVWTNLP